MPYLHHHILARNITRGCLRDDVKGLMCLALTLTRLVGFGLALAYKIGSDQREHRHERGETTNV